MSISFSFSVYGMIISYGSFNDSWCVAEVFNVTTEWNTWQNIYLRKAPLCFFFINELHWQKFVCIGDAKCSCD